MGQIIFTTRFNIGNKVALRHEAEKEGRVSSGKISLIVFWEGAKGCSIKYIVVIDAFKLKRRALFENMYSEDELVTVEEAEKLVAEWKKNHPQEAALRA